MNTQSLSLDVTKKPSILPVIRIGQGDKSGTILKVAIYDDGVELPLSSYTVRFCMRLPDGKTYYEVDGSRSGNIATFTIDESKAAAVPGHTDVAYVEVISGSTVICSTSRFAVVVLEGANTNAEAAETWVSAIEAARQELEELTEQSAAARQTYVNQETSQQQAFEAAQASRQTAYQAAEASRQSAFESAEQTRQNAESQRVTAESARASAESSRESAESDRVSSESARASAESSRTSAEQSRVNAEQSRANAEQARANAESSRASTESARVSAESGRVSAEAARVAEEARRVAEFADMQDRASGWYFHYCVSGEYSTTTGKPTISTPDASTLYLVPSLNPKDGDIWTEWIWDKVNSAWELNGSGTFKLDPITTAQIDSILAGTAVSSSEVMTAPALSYLIANIGTLTIGQL